MQVGDIYKTNNYGHLSVVEIRGYESVDVEFIDTGFKTTTTVGNIQMGSVKDVLFKSIYGVGYFGVGVHKAKISGIKCKKYITWTSILQRCYSSKCQVRNPTYKVCSVSEDWHNYQNFAGWFEENYVDGWEVDKDLLIIGNKVYSPDTCVFVPKRLNNFIVDFWNLSSNVLPAGVCKKGNKYGARCSDGKGGRIFLGVFKTEMEAHIAWRNFKLCVAMNMKPEMDEIDERIYPNIVKIISNIK